MKALRLNFGIQYRDLKVYQVCSNDNPRLTFDLNTARSNLCPCTFVYGENVEESFSHWAYSADEKNDDIFLFFPEKGSWLFHVNGSHEI